jgi:hypothetical protein
MLFVAKEPELEPENMEKIFKFTFEFKSSPLTCIQAASFFLPGRKYKPQLQLSIVYTIGVYSIEDFTSICDLFMVLI